MKRFIISLILLVSFGVIGWWALGLPRTSDATVMPAQAPEIPAGANQETEAATPDSQSPVWRTSVQNAVAEARDQKKDVLLLFTGNGPSTSLTPVEAKLASHAFRNAASNRFVLATFNCHPDTSAADDVAATRDIWAERLDVKSFPYLVLLDGRGRACAGVDLNTVDPATVDSKIAALEECRIQRDWSFSLADSQTGAEQAASLNAGLQLVKPYIQSSYQQVMEQILADDPNDKIHLHEVYFPLVTQSRIDIAVQHEIYPLIDRHLYQAAIDRITQLMTQESPPLEQRQLLLGFQGQLFSNLGDNAAALRTLNQAIAMAPNDAQAVQIKAIRDQIGEQKATPSQVEKALNQ